MFQTQAHIGPLVTKCKIVKLVLYFPSTVTFHLPARSMQDPFREFIYQLFATVNFEFCVLNFA